MIDATEEVKRWASLYFNICIWGAPAVLGLYGFAGWFIGMQNSRFPMFIAITQNIVNIAASLCFVFVLGMKVEGVALGTLIAQYAGLFMAFALWLKYYGRLKAYIDWDGLWDGEAMRRFFSVNSDIFFRTLCLVAVTTFFTSTGARQGDVILAVNTLLMQLFTLFSYIMDGFAYAGEALAGRFIGAKNDVGLRRCIRLLFLWGIGLSLSFTILYAFLGRDFLGLLTTIPRSLRLPGIISIGYWRSLYVDSPLSFGTVSLSGPRLHARCFARCLWPRLLSLLFITCFIDRWEIMRYGWLSLDISPCEVVCNGYFGDIGKLQCPL